MALPSIVLPAVALLALAAALAHRQRLARAETAWLIPPAELTYPDPPEVLGCGSQGVVVRAVHRGTSVAVKRFRARSRASTGGLSGSWVGNGEGISDGSPARAGQAAAATGRSDDLEGGDLAASGILASFASQSLGCAAQQVG
jgi:hypothetical protein